MDNQKLIREAQEQIQEDIMTYLDGFNDDIIDALCQIVVDNFAKLKVIK
jgi:hypothetical protein